MRPLLAVLLLGCRPTPAPPPVVATPPPTAVPEREPESEPESEPEPEPEPKPEPEPGPKPEDVPGWAALEKDLLTKAHNAKVARRRAHKTDDEARKALCDTAAGGEDPCGPTPPWVVATQFKHSMTWFVVTVRDGALISNEAIFVDGSAQECAVPAAISSVDVRPTKNRIDLDIFHTYYDEDIAGSGDDCNSLALEQSICELKIDLTTLKVISEGEEC